jgi:hypothetical protein
MVRLHAACHSVFVSQALLELIDFKASAIFLLCGVSTVVHIECIP